MNFAVAQPTFVNLRVVAPSAAEPRPTDLRKPDPVGAWECQGQEASVGPLRQTAVDEVAAVPPPPRTLKAVDNEVSMPPVLAK
eukprot:CAMPEP_0183472276 /NCGR_PEP_ID=MMETSP0370-20130417/159299_1 /TAXON_ID=268820 /ORGANISM="Peridinium aciculiferum, Strain PAER-2" /LENGTH=82 /DNA_ID=CAMNT_0025664905 /DNA_START=702 /DNA_END=951 /DNA_ORIENTATION=+